MQSARQNITISDSIIPKSRLVYLTLFLKMMKNKLDQLEARLKAFFEKSAQLAPQDQQQLHLAEQLVSVMRDAIHETGEGGLASPGAYLITMPPQALVQWTDDPSLKKDLLRVLQEAAKEAHITFDNPLSIHCTEDSELGSNEFRISIEKPEDRLGRTAAISPEAGGTGAETVRQFNAFLLLEGRRLIPLHESVINLGRMIDNQIRLEDPRVSRHHAQLRVMKNHYVLFDLNSTGGTYVNGQRIQQATLKPGDVISLAGVALIYGEESDYPSAVEQTGVIPRSSDDQKTIPGKDIKE